jgi:predicted MPP superfamily phosphohydrolase
VHYHSYENVREISRLLENADIELLRNRSEVVDVKGRKVRLTGVGDVLAQDCNGNRAWRHATRTCDAHFVLCHNPDMKSLLIRYSGDVMLAGHTHGGQVCLPFVGPLVLPVKDKRFVAGLYKWEGRLLHINRGLGNLKGIRFNCPPEISVLQVC